MSDIPRTRPQFIHEPDVTPACWTCVHKHIGGPTCDAFPNGIPGPILDGTEQHREPYPGDNGIQYELDPEEAEG